MRLEKVGYLRPGQIVAKTIFTSKLEMMHQKNDVLDENKILALKKMKIPYVYIHDELTKDIVIEPIIPEEVKVKAVSKLINIFNHYDDEVDAVIDDLIFYINDFKLKAYYATEIIGDNLYHYDHAVETSFLTGLIGKRLGFEDDVLKSLMKGALLSDIGKIVISPSILFKQSALTQEEYHEVKNHVNLGADIFRQYFQMDSMVEEIILKHHEKLDGSGYPSGLSAPQLPLHVRIVTIADIFTAMISDRNYKDRMSLSDALDEMKRYAPNQIDVDLLQVLFQQIQPYPQGTFVRLSDGRKGIVKSINLSVPSRPVVILFNEGRPEKELNLMDDLTIFISFSSPLKDL